MEKLFIALLLFYSVYSGASKPTILVTGGAGFIGYHTTLRLLEQDNDVIVVDSFSQDYNVELKKSRAAILAEKGAKIHEGDVCDGQFLKYFFDQYTIMSVVHLAAETSVTNSISDPTPFAKSNLKCVAVLLDTMSELRIPLVYTSTADVYGNSPHVPFSPRDPLYPALNIYSGLKIASEEMMKAYCVKHDMSIVVLRLFSVYGPWCRPTSGIYDIAVQISEGKTIKLHQISNGTLSSRDYTYIDDAVDGILSAMKYTPTQCGEIYNIGSGTKTSVDKVVQILETKLEKKAITEHTSLPIYKSFTTLADLASSKEVLQYSPHTSLEDGLGHFALWFDEYYVRNQHRASFSPDHSIKEKVHHDDLKNENHAAYDRLRQLKKKFAEYLRDQGRPYPDFPLKEKTFIAKKGKDSPGHDGRVVKGKSFEELKEMCIKIEECVGFNSNGALKTHIIPESKWTRSSGTLYIADLDICKNGLHDCYGNVTCTSLGPAQYQCGCPKGFSHLGSDCVEDYREGRVSQAEANERIISKIQDIDWFAKTKNIDFYKFSAKESKGGNMVYYPNAKGDVEKLKAACRRITHCIGFSTDGLLKRLVAISTEWKRSSHDLYVLDVDYCLENISCPRGRKCRRKGPGNYSCG